MNSPKNSLKKNYILNMLYQVLTILVPLITTPYISRVLHADGVGAYSYTFSVATYFGIFASMGVTTYGQMQAAQYRNDRYQCSKLFFGIFFAKLCTTLLASFAYYASMPLLGIYPKLYQLMIIYFVSELVDFTWFFQGHEEFGFIVTRNMIIKIIGTLCIFLFVKKETDLILYAVILQGSTLLGNALLCPRLLKFLVKVPVKELEIITHWKSSFIYLVPTIATSVYTILDKSMLGQLTRSAFENGYYEQAHKIEQVLVTVVTSLSVVTLPRVVYLYKNGQGEDVSRIVKKTTEFVLFLSFPMCVGLIAVSGNLVPVFLGEGFDPCVGLLKIFSLLIMVIGLNNIVGKQCLMAVGRQKYFNVGVITGAAVNLCMNLLLIPKLGAVGAAIGTVSAETIILIIFLIYSREFIRVEKMLRPLGKYGICSLLMGVGVFFAGRCFSNMKLALVIQIAVGVLIYLLLLLLLKDSFMAEGMQTVLEKLHLKSGQKPEN